MYLLIAQRNECNVDLKSICGGRSYAGESFSCNSLVFQCQYHSGNAP